MFTVEELKALSRSVDLAMQSCVRLSNRSGQPASVVEAYLRSSDELAALTRKLRGEIDKLTPTKEGKK